MIIPGDIEGSFQTHQVLHPNSLISENIITEDIEISFFLEIRLGQLPPLIKAQLHNGPGGFSSIHGFNKGKN
jgi:hypothetical protein